MRIFILRAPPSLTLTLGTLPMKPKGLSKTLLGASALAAAAANLTSHTASAASATWNGTTDALWATTTNWSASPVPGTGDTATFNNAGNGNTTIDLGGGVSVGAVLFDTSSVAAYTIGSGAVGSQTLTLGSTLGNVITMNSTVTANQLFNSNLALSANSTANNQATYYALTNNSLTNTLNIAGGISASTAGVKTLHVTGSGNTNISGAITSGSGNVSIFKTGSGTLTLSGGATWSGAGITDANFTTSAVFREGLTILNGGTYNNSNGELVVGGVAVHGGAGTNTTLQLNNGTTLNGISWLSVGRGNGTGSVTSNLVLNGNSTITTTNLSAGYNANNALNLPKGSITLNNTSTLTVTDTGTNFTFNIGESAGSDITMTVNDSAVVNRAGGVAALTAGNQQTQGAIQIGRAGTGTVIMNGGTINVASTDLGRGVNNTTAQNGTLTINTGATYNNEGDFRMGFAGGASGRATLNLQGGTLNVGSTTARILAVGTFDSVQSTLNIQSGNLNLNTNSNIHFNRGNNIGPNVINLNGGAITSFSDNQTTANGAGVLDMMFSGQATSNNTFNLNGGTLAIRQVMSTTNNGSRTFNFNGGTLKATGDTAAFMNLGTGTARANVRNGGAIIDTNGFTVTMGQALLHSNVGGDNATDGGLTKTGLGSLTVTNAANTYTGPTSILNGELATGATGNLGLGNVTVADSLTASLNLGNGSSIADTATLFFGDDSTITLNNGTSETLFGITQTDDSQSIGAGIFTAEDLNTFFGVSTFLGAGTLTVVPEPSTALLGGLGVLGLLRRRRTA